MMGTAKKKAAKLARPRKDAKPARAKSAKKTATRKPRAKK